MKELLLSLGFLVLANISNAQYCTNDNRFTEFEYFNSSQLDSIKDVQYGSALDYQGNPTPLYIDAYFPETTIDPLSERPLILMIHGGGFTMGNYKGMRPICVDLAKRGFVAVTMSYRLGYTSNPINAVYRAQQDANAAMRYLVANASTFQIDTSWMFIGGRSAGAGTANRTHYFDQSEWNSQYPTIETTLGSIDTSGNSLTESFTFKGIFNNWGAVPISAVQTSDMIPQIAFHGLLDNIVPIDSAGLQMGSRAIHYNLINNGVCSDITIDPLGGHGIFLSEQGTTFRASKASCFFKSVFCNSCVDILTTDSIPANCSTVTSIDETQNFEHKIYPNPTTGELTISGLSGQELITVYNAIGSLVMNVNHSEGTIDLSNLRSGLYYTRIQGVNSSQIIKVKKE